MKGLYPRADPASTKQGKQEVRSVAPSSLLAANGVGAIVPRHDPYAQREIAFPDRITGNPPLDIPYESAKQLDPIEDSIFTTTGKPPLYATAHGRVNQSFNIDSILSIDAWPPDSFYVGKWINTNVISTPRGFQTALIDSINIAKPDTTPYGSAMAVPGQSHLTIYDLYT